MFTETLISAQIITWLKLDSLNFIRDTKLFLYTIHNLIFRFFIRLRKNGFFKRVKTNIIFL